MVAAALADWRTAPIDDRLRTALGFLELLTRDPDAVGVEDVAALRAAGLTDEEIEDAADVCVAFSVIVRVADALGFDVPTKESFAARADRMLASGYALPPIPPSSSVPSDFSRTVPDRRPRSAQASD